MSKAVHVAGGVVLNRKGQVLVVNQRGRSWSLPKGHIEKGESVLNAARREIYEESGVKKLKFVRLLGSYERSRMGVKEGEIPSQRDGGAKTKKLTLFLFETDHEDLKPIDPDNPEARWVDRHHVADLLTHPKDREFFIQILSQIERELKPLSQGI
jgi:ADP-ribose pyrophosphatase YjhB (NUDIX family)